MSSPGRSLAVVLILVALSAATAAGVEHRASKTTAGPADSAGAVGESPTGSAPIAYQLVELRPGSAYIPGRSAREQPGFERHAAYMVKLFEAGRIVLGGPFGEDPHGSGVSGAILIVRAESPQVARRIVEADPGVRGEMLEIAGVHRFSLAIGNLESSRVPAQRRGAR
ncbi:MAG: YciI family protein [Candidatus Krumholzibacteriia bacterium]